MLPPLQKICLFWAKLQAHFKTISKQTLVRGYFQTLPSMCIYIYMRMCVYIHIYIYYVYMYIICMCVYTHIYYIYILYQCLLMQSIPTWWNVGAGVPLVHLMASQKVGSTCSTGDALGPGCRFQLCHSRQRNPIITYIYHT